MARVVLGQSQILNQFLNFEGRPREASALLMPLCQCFVELAIADDALFLGLASQGHHIRCKTVDSANYRQNHESLNHI